MSNLHFHHRLTIRTSSTMELTPSPSPITPISPLPTELRPVNLDFSAFSELFNKEPQRRGLQECIASNDFLGLKEIGMERGFGTLSDNKTRVKCWSVLLGCKLPDQYYEDTTTTTSEAEEEEEEEEDEGLDHDDLALSDEEQMEGLPTTEPVFHSTNSFSKLIHRDLRRNGYSRWDQTKTNCNEMIHRDLLEIEQLTNDIFSEHLELNYIQGLDSIISLFYVVSGKTVTVAKKMILSYLYIFRNDLALRSGTFGDIHSIWSLLKKYDSRFCKWLLSIVGGREQVAFALEWYISWFAHSSITDLEVVLRLFDFAIATQCMQISQHMVVAVLLHHKKAIMESVQTLTDFIVFCGGGGGSGGRGERDGSTQNANSNNTDDDGDDDEEEEEEEEEETLRRVQFTMDSVECIIERAQKIMESERKEEQRRNQWKSFKKDGHKMMLKIRRRSRDLIDDLVNK